MAFKTLSIHSLSANNIIIQLMQKSVLQLHAQWPRQ